jgi:outer membrane protein TolC
MPGIVRRQLALLLSVGLAAHSVRAAPLSHEEAVQRAVEHAPQMEARRQSIAVAQALSDTAGRLPDPELVLGLDNLPIEGRDAYVFGSDFMTMRKVGITQQVPSAAKRSAQRSKAQVQLALTQSQAAQVQLEVARSASQAWISLQSASRLAAAIEQLREQTQVQADTARAALAAGRTTTFAALEAQRSVIAIKDRALMARSRVQSARAELERWLGEPLEISLTDGPDIHTLPTSREVLLASMHRHALLQTLDQQIALARTDVELATAAKRPDYSVGVAYAKRGSDFADMVSLEFRVGLPLFAAHRQDPAIRAARSNVAELEAMRESELQMHVVETASELARWDAAAARYDLLREERVPLAAALAQTAQAAYRAGTGSLADVLAANVAQAELLSDQAEIEGELGAAWSYLRYLDAAPVAP